MKKLLIVVVALVLLPGAALANGGDQRVKDGYLVNLSRAPFTPIAGQKNAMLVSFVDLKTGVLIKEDALVTVRIGEGRGAETFIREDKDILIHGGVLEYSHTFANPGLHEIFFDFKFVNDSAQKIHELPDFLIDIQKPPAGPIDLNSLLLGGSLGLVAGMLLGWFFGRPRKEAVLPG